MAAPEREAGLLRGESTEPRVRGGRGERGIAEVAPGYAEVRQS